LLAANGVYRVAVELVLSMFSSDHSSCTVQYALKFVSELLVAASEKAVAIAPTHEASLRRLDIACIVKG